MLNSTNSSGNVLDRDAASSARQTKRYRVFREIVETEQNYVDVLYSILKVMTISLVALSVSFRTIKQSFSSRRTLSG